MKRPKTATANNRPIERVKDDFQGIIDKYSGNPGGKLARFSFANICYAAGAFDPAIAHFTQSQKDFEGDAFYERLIASGLGHAQAGKKDMEAAARTFASIAEQPDDFLKDEALFFSGPFTRPWASRTRAKRRSTGSCPNFRPPSTWTWSVNGLPDRPGRFHFDKAAPVRQIPFRIELFRDRLVWGMAGTRVFARTKN